MMTSNGGAPLRKVISRARDQLGELTGRSVEAVTAVERADDGWRLSIEVVELPRIPDSTSILGTYEVRLDPDGEVIDYARSARYHRNHKVEDEA